MARPKSNQGKINKHFMLSPETVTAMELELHSKLEGRVPVGAQSELVEGLLQKHFKVMAGKEKKLAAFFNAHKKGGGA